MAAGRNEESYALNLFILFYTLRYLWKSNKHPVDELYTILFPSKNQSGGNKTLYDNILRLNVKSKTIESRSARLAELTGLNERYFTGSQKMSIPTLPDQDWIEFIRLRRQDQGNLDQSKLKEIENKIKRELGIANTNRNAQSEAFGRLAYFAEYKHKKTDKKLDDLFAEIEKNILECRPTYFEQASLELLENHRKVVECHLHHLEAILNIRIWKNQRN